MISGRLSDDIPPQMKILNMVIHILMHFCSLIPNWSIASRTKPHVIQRKVTQLMTSNHFVLLLLIYCLMYFPSFVGVLCLSLFPYALLCVHSFFYHLEEEEKTGCFAIIVLHNIVTINVLWLFLTVQWVVLLCVTVVFSDHTHLSFHGRSV